MTPSQHQAIHEAVRVLHEIHGELPHTIEVVEVVQSCPGSDVYGLCDFGHRPPRITVRSDLEEKYFVEYLIHELAHLVCGLDEGHGDRWEETKGEMELAFWARRMPLAWSADRGVS